MRRLAFTISVRYSVPCLTANYEIAYRLTGINNGCLMMWYAKLLLCQRLQSQILYSVRAPFRRAEEKALESTRKCAEIHIRWIPHTLYDVESSSKSHFPLEKRSSEQEATQQKKKSEVEKWETQFLLYVSSRQAASIRCLWVTTRVKKAYLHTWPSPRPSFSLFWPPPTLRRLPLSHDEANSYFHELTLVLYVHTTGRRASELTHGEYAWIVWWSFMVGGSRCSSQLRMDEMSRLLEMFYFSFNNKEANFIRSKLSVMKTFLEGGKRSQMKLCTQFTIFNSLCIVESGSTVVTCRIFVHKTESSSHSGLGEMERRPGIMRHTEWAPASVWGKHLPLFREKIFSYTIAQMSFPILFCIYYNP